MQLEVLKPFLEEIVKIEKVKGTPESTGSYMGGHPFVPSTDENWEWPKARNDEPMIFVIQINFEDVPKGYGYPENGLMQIFIDLNAYVYDFNGGLEIVYYRKDELAQGSKSAPSDTVPLIDDQDTIHFDGSPKKIELNEGHQIPPETYWAAFDFDESEENSEDVKKLHQIFAEHGKAVADDFFWSSHQLGGTPDWIQHPAFGADDDEEPTPTFMLQIDTDSDQMFGDAGNMQVFGSLEKLHEGDFTDFKWDWACS